MTESWLSAHSLRIAAQLLQPCNLFQVELETGYVVQLFVARELSEAQQASCTIAAMLA
jgi:hypothetical protein